MKEKNLDNSSLYFFLIGDGFPHQAQWALKYPEQFGDLLPRAQKLFAEKLGLRIKNTQFRPQEIKTAAELLASPTPLFDIDFLQILQDHFFRSNLFGEEGILVVSTFLPLSIAEKIIRKSENILGLASLLVIEDQVQVPRGRIPYFYQFTVDISQFNNGEYPPSLLENIGCLGGGEEGSW